MRLFCVRTDSAAFSSFDEFEDNGVIYGGSILSPSEGEESDTEILIIPSTDVDLPSRSDLFDRSDAVMVAVHRFATLRKRNKRLGYAGSLSAIEIFQLLVRVQKLMESILSYGGIRMDFLSLSCCYHFAVIFYQEGNSKLLGF